MEATSEPDLAPNYGALCVKGRFGLKFVQHRDRLTQPLIRRNGQLVPTTWEEALNEVAKRFFDLKAMYGADSIAGFSCARATNEENLSDAEIHADGDRNQQYRSLRPTLTRSHGGQSGHHVRQRGDDQFHRRCEGGEDRSLPDDRLQPRHQPPDHRPADPPGGGAGRQTDRGRSPAHQAGRSGRPLAAINPGTDVAFLNGLMYIILEEELWDKKFVEERTEDFDYLSDIVKKYPPARVAEITGITEEQLHQVARLYAAPGRHAIYHGMGITHYVTGTDRVKSIANLAMLCGKVGVEGGGCNPLRGQNNVQGACDMGALFNTLPGYGGLNNDDTLRPLRGGLEGQTAPAARQTGHRGLGEHPEG